MTFCDSGSIQEASLFGSFWSWILVFSRRRIATEREQWSTTAESALELGLVGLRFARCAGFVFGSWLFATLFFVPASLLAGEANLAFSAVNSQHTNFDFVANFDNFFWAFHFVVGQFADVQQAFQAWFQLDEYAEVGELGDFALDGVARFVAIWDIGFPWILTHLLETQGDSLAVLIYMKDLAADLLALLEHFVWMTDLAGPRHVGDMQKAVDSFFDFDEGPIVGQVANHTFHQGGRGVLLSHLIPWVELSLLHAQ